MSDPPGRDFPQTRHSIVEAVRSEDPEIREHAFSTLVESYWKSVYKYLRLRRHLSAEDAEDTTQSFFAAALERSFFDRYTPSRARFRTYLRVCLDRFAANEQKARERLKRGGAHPHLSLDFAGAEGEIHRAEMSDPDDADAFFAREWTRSFFENVVDCLQRDLIANGKSTAYEVFVRYDLTHDVRPTYQELAQALEIPVSQVTNYLSAVRRRFRELVLERLREVTGSEAEFREAARELLGQSPE